MKILYVAMKYDYGDKKLGFGIEHLSFYKTLNQMEHQIIYFDFVNLYQTLGKDAMNQKLLDTVKKHQPQFLFLFPFKDQIDWQVIDHISRKTNTLTFAWFDNCVWRYKDFYAPVATCFNVVGTTESRYVSRYQQLGVEKVLHVQWGINPQLHQKLNQRQIYPVSFVGRPHGTRKYRLQKLSEKGINVDVWGPGSQRGKVTDKKMVRIFNQSQINLNFTETSHQGSRWLSYLRHQGIIPSLTQMKARLFEIPGCGGFMLTQFTHDLPLYYHLGKEIDTFTKVDEAKEKIQFYLDHPDVRNKMALKAYQKTIARYTYRDRFEQIFKDLRLK